MFEHFCLPQTMDFERMKTGNDEKSSAKLKEREGEK